MIHLRKLPETLKKGTRIVNYYKSAEITEQHNHFRILTGVGH